MEETLPIQRRLCPARVCKLPKQFSWVDQRLVQDRYIECCDAHALALYLFLVTVADAKGLSFYSDAAITKRLSMEADRLAKAREDLRQVGLIAYEKPLYQVLALEPPRLLGPPHRPLGQPRSIGELLREGLVRAP